MIKYAEEQPDEEIYKVISGRISRKASSQKQNQLFTQVPVPLPSWEQGWDGLKILSF